MGYLAYFIILCVACLGTSNARPGRQTSSDTILDVTKFGAIGDGKTDDSNAFKSVWIKACKESLDGVKISVPSRRTFLVSSIEFEGPCKSKSITFEILGTIVAPSKQDWGKGDKDSWLHFNHIDGLSFIGNEQGLIDGQGDTWWKDVKDGKENNAPTALRFNGCEGLHLSGITHKNSQKNHVSINHCNNANISNLHMIAPDDSPNTDAIDISGTTNLIIRDSIMETGDDCIAINGGTSNVNIFNLTCGPGHGISIGSLGKKGKHEEVVDVHVQNCTFIRTQNGVRIKTWQGGSGLAQNITFQDIIFKEAGNPVIIDQYYCPHKKCNNQTSAVQVSNVNYIGLSGTALPKEATINFSCSQTHPCENITLQNVDIKSANPDVESTAFCINAHGNFTSPSNPPVKCLKQIY